MIYIILPIFIMLLLDLFITVYISSNFTWNINQAQGFLQDWEFDFSYVLDNFWLAIGIIIAIAIVVIALGITLFSSGLKEISIKMSASIILYISVWIFVSVYSFYYIINIEIFGILIYIVLTFMYTLGVINQITK